MFDQFKPKPEDRRTWAGYSMANLRKMTDDQLLTTYQSWQEGTAQRRKDQSTATERVEGEFVDFDMIREIIEERPGLKDRLPPTSEDRGL